MTQLADPTVARRQDFVNLGHPMVVGIARRSDRHALARRELILGFRRPHQSQSVVVFWLYEWMDDRGVTSLARQRGGWAIRQSSTGSMNGRNPSRSTKPSDAAENSSCLRLGDNRGDSELAAHTNRTKCRLTASG